MPIFSNCCYFSPFEAFSFDRITYRLTNVSTLSVSVHASVYIYIYVCVIRVQNDNSNVTKTTSFKLTFDIKFSYGIYIHSYICIKKIMCCQIIVLLVHKTSILHVLRQNLIRFDISLIERVQNERENRESESHRHTSEKERKGR